jgi:hypothetical protein
MNLLVSNKKGEMKYFYTCLCCLFFAIEAFAQDSPADSALMKKIESEMQDTVVKPVQRSSLSFNPDIGLIGDFRAAYTSKGSKNIDAYLNETEISLQSVVDPYVRADVFISFARDAVTHEYGVEVEEGYLTTLTLPARLQLRAGKFRQAIGKINTIHPHALPFIDMPIAYTNYFGTDGLNDEGVSLSWLLPTTAVYQELVFETTTGFNESPVFARSESNRLQYLAHLKNVFTLNDNSTLELGLSGISGANEFGYYTNIGAADLTYKWKPVQMNTYRSLTWQSEFYYGNVKADSSRKYKSFGLYSYVEYQISKRWFMTTRYDYAQDPYYNQIKEQAISLTAGWKASEFHTIQFEVRQTDSNAQSDYFQGWIRWIFIIGAHGAHQY